MSLSCASTETCYNPIRQTPFVKLNGQQLFSLV